MKENDPVYRDTDGWYFWDETWTDGYGPYLTEHEAREALNDYIKNVLEMTHEVV